MKTKLKTMLYNCFSDADAQADHKVSLNDVALNFLLFLFITLVINVAALFTAPLEFLLSPWNNAITPLSMMAAGVIQMCAYKIRRRYFR